MCWAADADAIEYSNENIVARRESLARVLGICVFVVAFAIAAAAQGQQEWSPTRPIQLVVPYPPGGGTDALARILAQRMSVALGQPVVVENRPGAGATIATEHVARAAPDAHTLLMVTAPNAIGVTLFTRLPFDLLADFAPVAPVAATQFLLVANPAAGIVSLESLIDRARKQPGKVNFGSSGNATVPHLAIELIKSSAGVDLTHVPYKGAAPAIMDLLAGQVQLMAIDVSLVLPHVLSGKLRGIAVTGRERAHVVAEVPTLAEAGLPGYEILSWYGVLAPARVPAAAVSRLNAEITRIMKDPEVRERLIAQGTDPKTGSPKEFGDFLRVEVAKFARLVRSSGARID